MAATTVKFVAKHGLDNNAKTITNLGTSGSEFSLGASYSVKFNPVGNTDLILPTFGTLVTSGVSVLSSLSVIGTVTTGIWNASTIAINRGGTGITSTPAQGQILIGTGSGYTLNVIEGSSGILVDTSNLNRIIISYNGVNVTNSGTVGAFAFYSGTSTISSANQVIFSTTSSENVKITASSTSITPLKILTPAAGIMEAKLFDVANTGGTLFEIGPSGIVKISNSTNASNNITGALIVSGGIGVNGVSYLNSINLSTPLSYANGGTGSNSTPTLNGIIYAGASNYNSTGVGSTGQVNTFVS